MDDFLNFLTNNNTLAFGVALIIFIITLWLVVKRLIGFVITLLLLIFALISGFFVANQDLFRNLVKGMTNKGTPEERQTAEQLKEQFYKSYKELKDELYEQKAEFQKIIEKTPKKEEEKEQKPQN